MNEPAVHYELQRFLFEEAALLDSWKLKEWLGLFCADGEYQVPALDLPDAEPTQSLYLIDDDHQRLSSRVHQLLGRSAYSENPRSRTRRSITNVLFRLIDNNTINLKANFIINRFKGELLDTYVGHYDHMIIRSDGRLLFKTRRSLLDHEALRPQGKISIII